VKVNTLQALSELIDTNKALKQEVMPVISRAVETGTPAMKARAKQIFKLKY